MTVWDYFWWIIGVFLFIAYIFVLIQIFTDLFRDRKLSGGWKAVWIVFLIILPVITGLVYLIARGRGMSERQVAAVSDARAQADTYIKQTASTTPAEQIATAKSLLDAGTISQEEFDRLKARALA
ncbi:SHOCT domain-containing protein [Luteimicrobium sp. DT211]|uniref:SHOCT domain-containing protein n=1 Tax=Luteimicrobium sp. DT211 TaxID=3393412 RepID=UPI003CED38E4